MTARRSAIACWLIAVLAPAVLVFLGELLTALLRLDLQLKGLEAMAILRNYVRAAGPFLALGIVAMARAQWKKTPIPWRRTRLAAYAGVAAASVAWLILYPDVLGLREGGSAMIIWRGFLLSASPLIVGLAAIVTYVGVKEDEE